MIWLMVLLVWEGAYRLTAFDPAKPDEGGWRPWVFPSAFQVVDSTLAMLNVRTHFGEPFGEGWPWKGPPLVGKKSYGLASSHLVVGNIVSASRLAVGFGLSILLGGVLGLAMWRSRFLDEMLGGLCLGVQTLPSVCGVPLAILAFGINETAILFVLVMGSFFAVAIALRDGLNTIPPIYQRAGLMMGARGWRLYRYVLLPASLPAMAGSLRQGFSFAWRSLMGAELIFFIQGRDGLGHLLAMGREFNDVAQVVAVMIVMVFIGMVADRWIFARLQRAVHTRFGLA